MTAGTYTFTVTGVCGSLSHSVMLTLIVTKPLSGGGGGGIG